MSQLIDRVFRTALRNSLLDQNHDASVFEIPPGKVAFTTDSYVVKPLFFPGGDIGSLAVHGTVNDLAMAGARPLYLSAGFIIEEGFQVEDLWRIAVSMRHAADAAGVQIVTGDTKVVDRGKGDGVFINTSGVGVLDYPCEISPRSIVPGDAIILSGDLGRHGIAIMAAREGLSFETAIESDSAPLARIVLTLLRLVVQVHCLRDITRGGLTSVLNEVSTASGLSMQIDEALIPIRPEVRAACELLGLDPLSVACEGRLVAFVPQAEAERTVELIRAENHGAGAVCIGKVGNSPSQGVTLKSVIGTVRILDLPSGEQLPRIC